MEDLMQPQPGDTTVRLPVTFDYKGGRRDSRRGSAIVSVIMILILIVLTIFFIRAEASIWVKLGLIVGFWTVALFVARFILWHEQEYSDAFETLKEINNCPSTDSFWNIYEIEGSETHHLCRFRDGRCGIFIRFEKDVIVGKDNNAMFNHFDAISDAYNLAGSLDINMCQIDYMDNVGNDSRMQVLYNNLDKVTNEDMKTALLMMYSNLEHEMMRNFATYDVYLFTCKKNPDALWTNVCIIADRMKEGNYLTYRALDIMGIGATCKALFNLEEFSALEACENLFRATSFKGLTFVKVTHGDGTETVLGKTQEQLREEAAERARQAAEAEAARKNRKRKKGRVELEKPTPPPKEEPKVDVPSGANADESTGSDSFDLFE